MPNDASSCQQTFSSKSNTYPYCRLPSMDNKNMNSRYGIRPQVKPSPVCPTRAPKDMEFEAILYVASEAVEMKNDAEYEYSPKFDYETYSNESKWEN